MYQTLGGCFRAMLEEILEWDGSFDEFSKETSARTPFFRSTSLETIEKELIVSAKEYHSMNKHRSIMKILDRSTPSDMYGAQDVQSYSP